MQFSIVPSTTTATRNKNAPRRGSQTGNDVSLLSLARGESFVSSRSEADNVSFIFDLKGSQHLGNLFSETADRVEI